MDEKEEEEEDDDDEYSLLCGEPISRCRVGISGGRDGRRSSRTLMERFQRRIRSDQVTQADDDRPPLGNARESPANFSGRSELAA